MLPQSVNFDAAKNTSLRGTPFDVSPQGAGRETAGPVMLVQFQRQSGGQSGQGGSDFLRKDGTIDIQKLLQSQPQLSAAQVEALTADLTAANKLLQQMGPAALRQAGIESFQLSMQQGQLAWSFTMAGGVDESPLQFTTAQISANVASGQNGANPSRLFSKLQTLFFQGDPDGGAAEMFLADMEARDQMITDQLAARDKHDAKVDEQAQQLQEQLAQRSLGVVQLSREEARRLAESYGAVS